MLSAIAARKAAQAARQDNTSTEAGAITHQESVEEPERSVEIPTTKPNSKRKISAHIPIPKRKKRERRTPAKQPRYFAGKDEERDAFQEQDDIIVIDSDSDSEESLSDDGLDTNLSGTSRNKRKWSPSLPVNDSSDEEARDGPTGASDPLVYSTPTLPIPQILSTFQPIPEENVLFLTSGEIRDLDIPSYEGDSATLVVLSQTDSICLLGTYAFYVLQGSVLFSGVTIPASRRMQRVFAPRSSPLPILEGSIGVTKIDMNLSPRLKAVAENPVALVLLLESITNVEGLGSICRTFDDIFQPSRWQKNSAVSTVLQVRGAYMVTHSTKDIQAFLLPPSWDLALHSLPISQGNTPAGIYLIKGPKKSGKSTFARTLVNSLLTRYQRVAFLECDLGQSEFSPGGMVALNVIQEYIFGPPFTHPTIPNIAHYIGAATPRSSPSHYLAAIQSLLEAYRLDIQSTAPPLDDTDADDIRIPDAIPLVVNTMGWNKGLGADLTHKIEDMVQPTDIYEIEAPPSPDQRWMMPDAVPLIPQTHSAQLHTLEAIPPSILTTNYSAVDHRSLSILSYFHAIFPNISNHLSSTDMISIEQITATKWTTSLSLCARRPYEVEPTRSFDKIILTGAGMEDVVSEEVGRVLNGALVGLVSCEPGTLDTDVPMSHTSALKSRVIPYTQGFLAPSPATSSCHGLALIRSLSFLSPPTSASDDPVQMHILTPLPSYLLRRSRVLVKGELELPVWGMLDLGDSGDVTGVEREKVPYLQWGKGEGIGAEKRRVRRNLMRRGQM